MEMLPVSMCRMFGGRTSSFACVFRGIEDDSLWSRSLVQGFRQAYAGCRSELVKYHEGMQVLLGGDEDQPGLLLACTTQRPQGHCAAGMPRLEIPQGPCTSAALATGNLAQAESGVGPSSLIVAPATHACTAESGTAQAALQDRGHHCQGAEHKGAAGGSAPRPEALQGLPHRCGFWGSWCRGA